MKYEFSLAIFELFLVILIRGKTAAKIMLKVNRN